MSWVASKRHQFEVSIKAPAFSGLVLNRALLFETGWCERIVRTTGLLILFFISACTDSGSLSQLAPGATVVAFGDSLTYGTGVAPTTESYPAVLANLTGLKVIRSGVPGEISAAGLRRLPKVLADESPELVIICHGGNDVLRQLSAIKTEQNLRAMIKMARQSGAEVVLVAVPRFGLFPSAWDYYEDIAEDLNVPVEFDVISDLQRNPGMKSDQVHFNQTGYRLMAEALADLLRESGAL